MSRRAATSHASYSPSPMAGCDWMSRRSARCRSTATTTTLPKRWEDAHRHLAHGISSSICLPCYCPCNPSVSAWPPGRELRLRCTFLSTAADCPANDYVCISEVMGHLS
jgi:hypothetical protein